MSTTTFTYTGSAQTFTVPAACTVVQVDMCGGAAERFSGLDGLGYADRVTFTLAVTPGDVLTLYPGQDGQLHTSGTYSGQGANGYSGGGGGGGPVGTGGHGAGGGGSSAVLKSGTLLAEAAGGVNVPFSLFSAPVMVDAGGGGGYFGRAGCRGYVYGGNGAAGGGGGGSQGGNGGTGGTGSSSGGAGGTGVNGATHAGGTGGNSGSTPSYAGGTAYFTAGTTAHVFSGSTANGYSWVTGTGTANVAWQAAANTGYIAITAPVPLTADLIYPATGTTIPADPTFAWDYNASQAGNTMTGYVLRYKTASASAYSYYSGNWASPSSTPVTISATSPGVASTTGAFPVGNSYQWSVANVDQGGQGAFPTDSVWVSQAPPTVAITAPTGGVINGAQTTVTWTASAPSGASLTGAAVEVYSAAQWAAAGGVPFAGHPTTAASGALGAGTTSWATPNGILQNAVVYYVAVKVTETGGEQTIVTTSATCQFDGPQRPRLVVFPTEDGYGIPCVSVQPISMDNQLSAVESSFEGGGVGGWSSGFYVNCASGSVAKDGLYSLKLTFTGGGNPEVACGTSYSVTPGQLVQATAWFRAAATPESVQLGLANMAPGGASILWSTATTETTTGWTQVTVSGIVPASTTSTQLVIFYPSTTGSSGEIHYADQMGLYFGATLGAYSVKGTHVILQEPWFTQDDVGSVFAGTTALGVQTCAPIAITSWVSPYEVVLASTPGGAGAIGYIGPWATSGQPNWSIGGLTQLGWIIESYDSITGNFRYVRDASPTSYASGLFQQVDYEATPQDPTYYWVTEVASNGGATVSTTAGLLGGNNPTGNPITLVTDRVWIFDPVQVPQGYNVAVDGHATTMSLGKAEAITAHKQVGNPYPAMITDTVGGVEGSLTIRVIGAARWQQIVGGGLASDTGLATTQATVCISDPLGGFYYGRLGLTGATGGGASAATATGAYIQANIANQYRDVSLQFSAQPPPAP